MADVRYTISLVDRVTQVANRINTSFNRIGASVERASDAVSAFHLLAGGAAVAGIFKMGAELESTRLKFNTLTGSVEAGTKLFEDLTEFANMTPFSNEALNQNANTLLAFGADASEVTGTLKMLGDIAAGDHNRLKSLTLAFSQSRSAGRLMGQDLLQMVNVGFNPLQEIAKQTGIDITVLKKRMEQGQIPFSMVEQAFKSATLEGGRFHGLTEKMSQTMAGKWSTVMGKAKFLISEFGLSMKDIFLPFLEGILKAIEFISKYKKAVFALMTVLTTLVGVLLTVGVSLKVFKAFRRLKVLLLANPIILIITAIAALVAILIIAWKRSEKFRRVMTGVWNVMKELFNLTFGNLIPVIKRLSELFGNLFNTDDAKGFLSVIKDGILKYFKWILSVVGSLAQAINFLFKGEFKQALAAVKGGFMGMDTTIIDAFTSGASKAKAITKEGGMFGESGLGGLSLGLSPEAQKLQAQGVVSGGIKTFNININQLTGVGTLSTTNMEESSGKVGDSIIRALTEALADVKNID